MAPSGAPAALGAAASALVPAPARVRGVRRETPECFTITLDPPGGAASFRFAPGQFNMLYLFGVGEVAISVSGDPAQTDRVVHTIREVGTVTRALGGVRRGDVLGVRGPYGAPWPLEAARGRDVLIVAGGLGLAPLWPALLHLLRHAGEYGRVTLLVGARSPEELLFTRQLARLRRGGAEVMMTVDRADGRWRESVGVVTALLRHARFEPARTTALLCGPEIMMRFAVRELERLGVRDEDMFLSMERNMKCAVGLCGRCQYGPLFVCKDGPVLRHDRLRALSCRREV